MSNFEAKINYNFYFFHYNFLTMHMLSLDPGTGSIILQTLAFLLAAGLAFFQTYGQKIKFFFCSLFSRKSKTYIEEKEK